MVSLHRAARIVVEEYGGEIPSATVVLVRLPTIGPYMAGAVACFAFEGDVVAENPSTPPEEWQSHVLRRAKENGSGEYSPGYWAARAHLRAQRPTSGASALA